jgi:hypothetical protein
MVKQGHPPSYAAGITTGSSLIGPIIPPSIFMILYASMTGTSVGGLFLAGVVPGVLGCVYVLWAIAIEERVHIARRDVERENDIFPDHNGRLLAEGVMLTSLEWLFSWSWHHGLRIKRLELAYRQSLSLVSEIPATFEYIDFEGPPDRLQVTKIRGYPTGLGSVAGGRAAIISHIPASFGNCA